MSRRKRKLNRSSHRKHPLNPRPGTSRGPGPVEREMRGLPTPSDERPKRKFGSTVFQTAEKPGELREDARIALEVLRPKEAIPSDSAPETNANHPVNLRKRGLPHWLAEKFYEKNLELLDNPELTETNYKQLAQAANMIAKVDVETARFQLGEAAATQVQVNNVQTSPAELMKAYLNEVQDRISAAYPEPPIDIESEPILSIQVADMSDEIAEAIKAEVPALKGMNGALSKIVKKVMEDKKKEKNDE